LAIAAGKYPKTVSVYFSTDAAPVPTMPPLYSNTVSNRMGLRLDVCSWWYCGVCLNAVSGQGGNSGEQYILSFDCHTVLCIPALVVSLPMAKEYTEVFLAVSLLWTVLSVLCTAAVTRNG